MRTRTRRLYFCDPPYGRASRFTTPLGRPPRRLPVLPARIAEIEQRQKKHGGGVTFGPHPRDYAVKRNRKAARRAKLIALSQHAALESLGVFDGSAFSSPKTRDARALVQGWGQQLPLVVLVGEEESQAALSFRNLARVIVAWAEDITVVELLWARSLLVSQVALADLQGGAE